MSNVALNYRLPRHFPTDSMERWWQLLPSRSVVLTGLLFGVIYAFPFFRKGDRGDWAHCYVPAAERMLHGEVIHRLEPWQYAYPPAMAMLCTPLASLPTTAALAGWYAVNLLSLAIAVTCVWRLSGGPSISRIPRLWQGIFGCTMLLSARYLIAPLENYQFDLVIAAMLFGGCYQLSRGRDFLAAAWLGAATAMKCTPLLFAPYLVWRGKWKAAGLLVAVAIVLNLLPDLFFRQTNGGSYNADWFRSTTHKVGTAAPGEWFSDTLLNQSLAGLCNRLAVIGIPLSADDLATRATILPDGKIDMLRLLVPSLGLLLIALTIKRCGGFGRSATLTRPDSIGFQPTPFCELRTAIECGAVCCLMLLLSPMSSKHHYVVLLLPVMLIARSFCEHRTPAVVAMSALLLCFGPLSAKDLIGRSWGSLTLAWGLPTYFVLTCLAGMWLFIGQTPGWRRTGCSTSPAMNTGLSRAA